MSYVTFLLYDVGKMLFLHTEGEIRWNRTERLVKLYVS